MAKKLFQHSTIGALMAGMFEGTLTIEELLKHGDTGIGTLHGLDGELVLIDGTPYQVKVVGTVVEVDRSAKTPYAAVTHFEEEEALELEDFHSGEVFKKKLIEQFTSKNTFQAVKMTGTFQKMHCRSVEKQEEPYPRLTEVAEDQAEFKHDAVEGTLIGFYTPEIFGAVSVSEFHLHFLSADKTFGGHVLDFDIKKGRVEWQTIDRLEQDFPVKNKQFMESDIDYSRLAEDIEAAE